MAQAAHPSSAGAAPGQGAMLREPVYVFELPVRLAHWLIFFSVVTLSATGWMIGGGGKHLPAEVTMAEARMVHVITAWVMISSMVMRIIWLFTGNRWASWKEWVPVQSKRIKGIFRTAAYYLFLRKRYPEPGGGHNPLAGATYLVVYALLGFMAVSGVALHGYGNGEWHDYALFAMPVMANQTLRFLHHCGMWLVWGFVVHHVASALLIDSETRGNCMTAIFSGWRQRDPGEGDEG